MDKKNSNEKLLLQNKSLHAENEKLKEQVLQLKNQVEENHLFRSPFDMLFETSLYMMILADAETNKIIKANKTTLSAFGYSLDELREMKLEELAGCKKTVAEILEYLKNTNKKNNTVELKIEFGKRKDGSLFPVEATLHYARDTIVGVFKNISETLKHQLQINSLENKLKAIYETSPDAVIITNNQGVVEDCNINTVQILKKKSKNEITGKPLVDLLHGRRGKELENAIKETFENGTINRIEYTNISENEILFYEMSASAICSETDKNIEGAVFHIQDITQRKNVDEEHERKKREILEKTVEKLEIENYNRKLAQQQSKHAEAKFRALFDNTPQIAILLDTEFKIIEYNKEADENQHLIFNNSFKRNISIFETIKNKTYYNDLKSAIENANKGIHDRFYKEIKLSTGIKYWYDIHVIPVYSDMKNITGIFVNMFDINQIKQAQEDSLRIISFDRYLNEQQKRFMDILSDEFKTPLTVIKNNISLLAKKYDEIPTKKRLNAYQTIEKKVDQLTEITRHVGYIKNKDSYKVRQNFSLIKRCKNIINEYALGERNRTINLRCNPTNDKIFFNQFALDAIIRNLLSNAVKYSDANTPITVHCHIEPGKRLEINVEDQGVGIIKNEQELIFKAFYRGSNVKSNNGVGLGLTVVQSLVIRNNGDIKIDSKINQGSKIKITFPISAK